jgi:hypothetical protein
MPINPLARARGTALLGDLRGRLAASQDSGARRGRGQHAGNSDLGIPRALSTDGDHFDLETAVVGFNDHRPLLRTAAQRFLYQEVEQRPDQTLAVAELGRNYASSCTTIGFLVDRDHSDHVARRRLDPDQPVAA